MITDYKNFLTTFLLGLSFSAVGFFFWFGSALGQEKDTAAILWAAARLQLESKGAIAVDASGQRYLVRDLKELQHILEGHGLKLEDRLGGTFIYRRQGQRVYLGCGAYTSHYLICDLHSPL